MTKTILLYTAFEGSQVLISGRLDEVALKVRRRLTTHPAASILIFSDVTGKQMDLDLRGSESEMMERLRVFITTEEKQGSLPQGPGRPKLGVLPREVSLMPRHWEWLATQSGGASATLRRLVEEASKNHSPKELIKMAQERTHAFMTALAGNLSHYEEALRALYAKEKQTFQSLIRPWPEDIRTYVKKLAKPVWEDQ